MAKIQPQAKAPDNGAGGRKGGVLIALVVLTLLAGGTGGGLGVMLASTIEAVVTEKAKAVPPMPEEPPLAYSEPDTMLEEMKPVVSNLAAPSSTFVRIEASIVYKKGALPNPQIAAAEVREDIMSYLRSMSLSEMEGPSGLLHLREDLNERAQLRSQGHIDELVLETMVVQ